MAQDGKDTTVLLAAALGLGGPARELSVAAARGRGSAGEAPAAAAPEARSVSVTSTGRVLFSNAPRIPYYPIDGTQVVRGGGGYPCPFGGCDLTVTNNLGSSATVFLGKPTY